MRCRGTSLRAVVIEGQPQLHQASEESGMMLAPGSYVGSQDGNELSSTAIRARIRKLIAQEDPKKPLSDNKLSKLLEEEGIQVARRTVAKYREAMTIPSSSDRKRLAPR